MDTLPDSRPPSTGPTAPGSMHRSMPGLQTHANRKPHPAHARAWPCQKVFNCIVDDTALLAAARKLTRDGIRKWVASGAIRLFVPLHTLEQLDRLKRGKGRINTDARDVIAWLDEITSMPDPDCAGQVLLQGVDESYATWKEVESFLLPETLLSTESELYELDNLDEPDEESDHAAHALERSEKASSASQSSLPDMDPRTPSSPRSAYSSTSPGTLNASPCKGADTRSRDSTAHAAAHSRSSSTLSPSGHQKESDAVPPPLRPLFSYMLWRVNQEQRLVPSGLDSFLLLTNDPGKGAIAQRFGIRVRSSDQLRQAIGREERDYKNRLLVSQKEAGEATNGSRSSENDEEVLLTRPPRVPHITEDSQKVWDPDDFGRSKALVSTRGGRGGRGRGFGRGHLNTQPSPSHSQSATGHAIDPDSFSRPPASRNLRGGRRRLWEPT